MNFDSFWGNEHLKKQLLYSLEHNRLLNSYVFVGEEGIGKKTLSSIFVASVMCDKRQPNGPCGTCSFCVQTAKNSNPDIIYLKKDPDKKTIGINEVREQIIKNVYIKPFSREKKFFIINDGDLLTEDAQNSLLKVLEEPPEYVTFIILVTKASTLLDTVLSRSLVLNLHPVSYENVFSYMKQNYRDKDEQSIVFCSKYAQGIIGKAIKMMNDTNYRELFETTSNLLGNSLISFEKSVELRSFLVDNKDRIDDLIEFMLIFSRDLLLSCESKREMIISEENVLKFADKIKDEKKIVSLIDTILGYKKKLSANVNFTAATLDLLAFFSASK